MFEKQRLDRYRIRISIFYQNANSSWSFYPHNMFNSILTSLYSEVSLSDSNPRCGISIRSTDSNHNGCLKTSLIAFTEPIYISYSVENVKRFEIPIEWTLDSNLVFNNPSHINSLDVSLLKASLNIHCQVYIRL